MTLEWIPAATVLAAGKRNAPLAVFSVKTELAAALVGTLAIALLGIAILFTLRDVAKVSMPPYMKEFLIPFNNQMPIKTNHTREAL